jgi:Ca-activated chloride channel homolog
VAPTTDRSEVDRAIDTLTPQPRTATGEGILTALQAIASYTAVTGGGDGPPPARIVLESDGAENVPADPEAPRGAFTAARAARDQHVEISTISFGTPTGTVTIDGAPIPVPVDDATLQQIATITRGQQFHAATLGELSSAYSTLDQQIGYQTVHSDASAPWVALGLVAVIVAVASGLLIDRRVPV